MSNQWLSFNSEYVIWPIITSLVLLTLLVMREALKDISRKRKIINILASALALGALLMIWLKPQIKAVNPTSLILLLTDGYTQTQRDSILTVHSFIEEEFADSLSYEEQQKLIDQRQILMIGHGIPEDEWPLWSSATVDYVPNHHMVGITRLKYEEHYTEGENFHVSGLLKGINSSQIKLNGFGKVLDSVEVTEGNQAFSLSAPIKNAGRFVYSISMTDSAGNESVVGEIPVQVKKAKRLKLLMINSFPTFEQKYLKNFLAAEGHQIAVRNQLSKDRYQFEFYNTKKQQRFYNLNESVFEGYDIVIADYNTFKQLNTQSISALRDALAKGLGIFILPTEDEYAGEHVDLFKRFDFSKIEGTNTKVITFHQEKVMVPSFELNLKPNRFQYGVLDNLMVYQPVSLGAVGTNVLKNSYQLVLNGKGEIYQWLWKKQLEVLSYTTKPPGLIGAKQVFVNKPYHFQLRGFTAMDDVVIDSTHIPMQQDPHLPKHWQGTYWPYSAGWHQIMVNSQDTLWFYVQNNKKAWRSLIQADQVKANQRIFAKNGQIKSGRESEVWQKINPIWFYLLFLISVAYLWIEPKIL